MLKSPLMVISERRPGTTDVITRVPKRPTIMPEGPTSSMGIEVKPLAIIFDKNDLTPASETKPSSWLNFLDFHHPQLEEVAIAHGFEHGRVFLDKKKNRTYSFLSEAVKDNVIDKLDKRPGSKLLKSSLRKTLEGAWFFICTDATFAEIAQILEFSNKSIPEQRLSRLIRFAHEASSLQLQERYPLKTLTLERQITDRQRNLRSSRLSGRRAEIKDLYDQGITDSSIIAEKLGIENVYVSRTLVEIRRFTGEKTKKARSQELMTELSTATKDRKRQIIAAATPSSIQENPNFTSIRMILRTHKLPSGPQDVRLIIDAIRKRKDIPYRRLAFWSKGKQKSKGTSVYVFSEDVEKIIGIYQNQKSKIELVDNAEAAM